MRPGLEIRPASRDDAATIHRLLMDLATALGKPGDIRSSVANIEQHGFGDQPRFETLLAFVQQEAVGMAIYFYEYSTWRGQPGAYIQDLYVSPQMRGSGLGRKLIEAVKERTAEQGCRYLRLSVYDGNPDALAFYRKVGFELCADEQALVLRY